jgi:hypothetical protein
MEWKNVKFVICINNDGCDDLQLRKIYQVLPDKVAAQDDYIRVIDDSGEDYLYPADNFIPIALPQAVEQKLLETPAALI